MADPAPTTRWARMNPIKQIVRWYEKSRLLEARRLRNEAAEMIERARRLELENGSVTDG
jgi:hypothetical protein